MGNLFQSLKQTFGKLKRSGHDQRASGANSTSVGGSTEKEAEQAPPNRVGEVVGHSSGG